MLQTHLIDFRLNLRQFRTLAYKQQLRRDLPAHLGKNINNITHPFDRTEIADMHQYLLIRLGKITAEIGYIARIIHTLVNKVIGQINITGNIQHPPGFLDQILRDSRNRITFIDSEADQILKRFILAQHGNVRPVQCCDYLDVIAEHLLGQEGTHGMRHRIMNME
ncbi:hypothetical protein D3C75_904440 [compost metagenome]